MKLLILAALLFSPISVFAQNYPTISGEELLCEYRDSDGTLLLGSKEYLISGKGSWDDARTLLAANEHLLQVKKEYNWGMLVSMTKRARELPSLHRKALEVVQSLDELPGFYVDCNQSGATPLPSVIVHN